MSKIWKENVRKYAEFLIEAETKTKQIFLKKFNNQYLYLLFFCIIFVIIIIWFMINNNNVTPTTITITNPVVVDGDTFLYNDTQIRIIDIDAPELTQICKIEGIEWHCGLSAKNFLTRNISTKILECNIIQTKYNYKNDELKLARCFFILNRQKIDLGKFLVESGYAVSYKRYSSTYNTEEEQAKVNQKGIWIADFEIPHDFKVRHIKNESSQIGRSVILH